jgi:hypothetical protein
MPPTLLADAFLRALIKWAARSEHGGTIVIPSGRVDSQELRRVVKAIVCAGTNAQRIA